MMIRVFVIFCCTLCLTIQGSLASQQQKYPGSIQVTISGPNFPPRPNFSWNPYSPYQNYFNQQLFENSLINGQQNSRLLIKSFPSYNPQNSVFYTQANNLELYGQSCVPTSVFGTSQNNQRQSFSQMSQVHTIEKKGDGVYVCVRTDKPNAQPQVSTSNVSTSQIVQITEQNKNGQGNIKGPIPTQIQTVEPIKLETIPVPQIAHGEAPVKAPVVTPVQTPQVVAPLIDQTHSITVEQIAPVTKTQAEIVTSIPQTVVPVVPTKPTFHVETVLSLQPVVLPQIEVLPPTVQPVHSVEVAHIEIAKPVEISHVQIPQPVTQQTIQTTHVQTPKPSVQITQPVETTRAYVVQPAGKTSEPIDVYHPFQPVTIPKPLDTLPVLTQKVQVYPVQPNVVQTQTQIQAQSSVTSTSASTQELVLPTPIVTPVETKVPVKTAVPVAQPTPITTTATQALTTIVTLSGIQDQNCIDHLGPVCYGCSFRFVLEGAICVPVNPLCATFDNTGSCLTCYPGYDICENGCVITACFAQPYYPDPNCNIYAPNGTCMACSHLYYFNTEGLCTQVNPNCKSSNSNGNCLTCYGGYHLDNNLCVLTANQVMTDLCNRFENGVCVSCSNYSYLNTTTHTCIAISPLCKSYDNTNGYCLECYSGYELSRGLCVLSSTNSYPDKLCRTWSSEACKQCSDRAYFVNGICTNADPLCRTFDSINGFCLSCFNGYHLTQNKCVLDLNNSFFGSLCRVWQNGKCVECSQRAVDVNGVCTEVNPLCNAFDSKGNCLTCFSGYLVENGRCILAPLTVNALVLNLCLKYQNAVCTLCAQRAYLQDSTCVQVNPLCHTFDNKGQCSSCYIGYILQNGLCNLNAVDFNRDPLCAEFNGSTCIKCANRAFVNNSICTEVNVNCNTFDAATGACLTCYRGYELRNNQCVALPNLQPPPPSGVNLYANIYCKRVDSQGKCTQCFYGFKLENGDCIQDFGKYCKDCKK